MTDETFTASFTYDELEWLQDVTDRVIQGSPVIHWAGSEHGRSAVQKILNLWGRVFLISGNAELGLRSVYQVYQMLHLTTRE